VNHRGKEIFSVVYEGFVPGANRLSAGGSGNVSEMAKWRQISYPLGVGALDPKWKARAPFFMN
jgi:hypothetical protein